MPVSLQQSYEVLLINLSNNANQSCKFPVTGGVCAGHYNYTCIITMYGRH